jgi:6-pyruvoyltetrahydropterin/6-carboxytetrahydropterin synthase
MKIKTQESFPASHFVQTAGCDSPCRRLHGHTWTIIVEIEGQTQPDGMVVDFRDIKTLIKRLDHKVLIPTTDSNVTIMNSSDETNYLIDLKYNHYSFPKSDCCLLPIKVVTAENLTEYFVKQMSEEMFPGNEITIQVWESENSYAEASSI